MKQPDKGDADKKRVIGKPFVKGQVANPKGRPKDDIAALARCYGVEALTTLVRMLVVEKYAVQAATVLLDRGYGKPKQESEHNINVSIKADQLSDDDLARLVHRAAVKTIEHHATPMQHGDVTDVDAVDISKG
jgi:phage gp46-like protein